MNMKKIVGVAGLAALSGMSLASASDSYVHFENAERMQTGANCDAPDICLQGNWLPILISGAYDCDYINGELEKREAPYCEPDTFLVCFDKNNNIIESDDNDSNKGNGWASGFTSADCFIDNGDGTRSLRLGVTGRPDGLDGVFNGLFQNGPHGQLGAFVVCIEFSNQEVPLTLAVETYEDEFYTGSEAFYINYAVPADAISVRVNIDNQINSAEVRCDVDFMKLSGLVPLCDYCIEQIGGIDCECRPTNTILGWFDKSCNLILHEDTGGAVEQYAKLCVVADANGDIIIGVTGFSDWNFNGLADIAEGSWLDGQERAPAECPEPKPGHDVAGCYTLKVYATVPHDDSGEPMPGDSGALMQLSLDKGDLNMDGQTNSADLGILLGNFGWVGN